MLSLIFQFAKWFSYTWTFGEFLCKGVHFLQNISVICSVLTLTMMSIERYGIFLSFNTTYCINVITQPIRYECYD